MHLIIADVKCRLLCQLASTCTCHADLDNYNSTDAPASCEDWEENNSTLGFGGNLASAAAAINASSVDEALVIAKFASGNVLPTLHFDVIDHFGNLVSGAPASML